MFCMSNNDTVGATWLYVRTVRRLGYDCTVYLNQQLRDNMYHVGRDHACAKDAAHIHGEKSSSGMKQLWPLQNVRA